MPRTGDLRPEQIAAFAEGVRCAAVAARELGEAFARLGSAVRGAAEVLLPGRGDLEDRLSQLDWS